MTELPKSVTNEVQSAMSHDAALKLLGVAAVTQEELTAVIDRAAEAVRTQLAGRKAQQ